MSKINYKVEGKGDSIVFIHGLSDDLNYWEILATDLKNEYKVIRFDLRGHGESELGSEDIKISTYVDDLKNLLDELNVKKANLVGFSLGGLIALDFTVKYSDYVSSLVLMSSFSKSDDYLVDVLNQFKMSLNKSFEEFFDLILPKVLCPSVIENNLEELEMLKQISAQNANCQAYIEACDVCIDFDIESELYKINIPTLILAGKYDEISRLNHQKSMHDKISESEFIVFDDVKHNLLVGKNNLKVLHILKNLIKKESK